MVNTDAVAACAAAYFAGGTAAIAAVRLAACFAPSLGALAAHGKVLGRGGRAARWTVPKRLFGAFYAVGMAAAGCALLLRRDARVALLLAHLCRRACECAAWPYGAASRMHAVHAAVGLSYYPVLVCALHVSGPSHPSPMHYALIVALSMAQSLVHRRLYAIRRSSGGRHRPLTRHALFRAVLCPHYSAEAALHVVLAAMTSAQSGHWVLPWLNVVFVVANLASSAHSTAAWHARTFPSAPRPLGAIVPYIL